MLVDTFDSYQEGRVWKAGSALECEIGGLDPLPETWDLTFTVEFCLPPTTGVQRKPGSWGKLKVRYR